MTIEVTSVAEQRRVLSLRKLIPNLRALTTETLRSRQNLIRTLAVLLALLVIVASISVRRSYSYYAAIVDARLARGYLTSRPGLYSAPTTLRPGQGLSASQLVMKLRRAGYIEANGSDVWSGSFSQIAGGSIEIRPSITTETVLVPIQVAFDPEGRIAALTRDGASLESFKLEPEVLTNDIEVKSGERRVLAYPEIPPMLTGAILAIEDRRFFDHPGLDPLAVIRAILRNASDERVLQGGSTITQQLVKNTYLTRERTLRRKYAEAMLAFALERRLSKEDIFALYCNEIYLGQRGAVTIRGVEQAAEVYFGKKPKDLSLSEAATIAGMIQGPTRFSPVRQPAAAETRRNVVLEAMVREGFITAAEAKEASAQKVITVNASKAGSLAPHFVDYVNRISESQFQISGDEQRIYTTIDLDLQKLAEIAVERQLSRLTSRSSETLPEAALVALDPHTGDVLAMVGGRDYEHSQLNRATDAHRQPGSTFKPFVYAAALEDGVSPMAMFEDAPREFIYDRNKTYRPENFGGAYSMRDVTLRDGLIYSLNTVTVAVAMRTGLARTANLAEQFGLPKPKRFPSLALGTSEVTPLELTAAYATFVNGGKRIVPRVVAGISEPVNESCDPQTKQVIKPTTAYMITNMLSGVIERGTARAARGLFAGTAIAGKTGTSRDGWFVGFTPNLVCAVWIGFDDNRQLGLTAAQAALPAWTDFMKAALTRRPELGGENFVCPEGIKFVEIDTNSGLISTLTCPSRELIAVSDRLAPHMECYFHGNLLPSEPERITSPSRQITMASRNQPPNPTAQQKIIGTTRVDVDSRGRRTLVNDLR